MVKEDWKTTSLISSCPSERRELSQAVLNEFPYRTVGTVEGWGHVFLSFFMCLSQHKLELRQSNQSPIAWLPPKARIWLHSQLEIHALRNLSSLSLSRRECVIECCPAGLLNGAGPHDQSSHLADSWISLLNNAWSAYCLGQTRKLWPLYVYSGSFFCYLP